MAQSLAKTYAEAPPPEAVSRNPVDRQRLLYAMIDLCEAGHGRASEEAQALIGDIFMDLVKRAERDLRLRLAEKLSSAPWAPSGLINALALDDIEIARPVIAKSPVLQDHDLIRLLTAATIEHQIEVARRPGLGEAVVTAILDQADPVVMTTLAGNDAADLSTPAMTRLVSASRRIAALRAPLSRHPKLNMELACALYSWVGETLKTEISGRFRIDGPALDKALNTAIAQSLSGAPALDWRPATASEETDQQEMETRLIAKLEAAGQLRPGFLLRSLREGKLYLFEVALASLASVKTEDVRKAANSSQPELLALACASIGIDRSVFPTILSLVRALNQSKPFANAASLANINAAFTPKGDGEAIAAFRQGVSAL
jgi:uncharacterized protein (DUF2336 family)